MSQLCLKAIALLAMTIDHLGLVFGREGWNLLPVDSSMLRAVGRLSFPIFAFCIAQGWHKTRNRNRYFLNLALGAVASQIPFTIAFYGPNFSAIQSVASSVWLAWPYLVAAAVATGIYWKFILQKRYSHSVLLVVLAGVIPGIRIQIHGFWILCESANVFYTFLMSLFCLYILSHRYEFGNKERIALFFATPVLLLAYGLPADYGTGLLGIVLIVGFTILTEKVQQLAFLCLWSLLFYGFLVDNLLSAVFCALSGVGIFLYNPERRGRFRVKRLFYWYYPLHLLVLGLVNAGLRATSL